MRTIVLGMALWSGVAGAAPRTLVESGRLTSPSGAPLHGVQTLTFKLYDPATPSVPVWQETHDAVVEDGYFAAVLGTSTPLDPTAFARDLEVSVTVGGVELHRRALHSAPYALAVEGAVQVTAAPTACTATDAGTLRWSATGLEVCTGTAWGSLFSLRDGATQERAALSCEALKRDFPSLPSGAYYIDPDGGPAGDAYHLWCDMSDDDGGWTLVMSIQNGGTAGQPGGAGAYNVALLDDGLTPAGSAKIPDDDINLLGNEFRHTISSPSSYERFYLLNHAFANTTGQVTTGDRCRTSTSSAWITVTSGPSYHSYGLASTEPGDGCGTCADRCGGGTNGSWWSWYQYFGTSNSNGSYSRTLGYTGGWMYVR